MQQLMLMNNLGSGRHLYQLTRNWITPILQLLVHAYCLTNITK